MIPGKFIQSNYIIIQYNKINMSGNFWIDKQIFYVNSRNRLIISGDNNSNFSYEFNIDPNIEYDSVVMLDGSVPKSNYMVSSGYNTFTVTENLGAGDLVRTITMPLGNYTRDSYLKVLKTQLNDNPNTYVYNIIYLNINNTQDDGLYYFTWTNVNPSAQEPIFTFRAFPLDQRQTQKFCPRANFGAKCASLPKNLPDVQKCWVSIGG
eukprot:Lithocolla_globosa_v1_NODE_121_length_6109_cov_174.362075.p1 type:complete len:207 gc:universal NODE_121_length_6109_cov_174.362075:4852-4232(-)